MRGLTFFTLLFVTTQIFAVNYSSKDEYLGNWSETSSWDGSAPSYSITQGNSVTINGTIECNESITLNKENTITVEVGDTLIVNGNINLNKDCNIIIKELGVLIILGNFSSDKDLDVAASGKVIVFGNFTTAKDAEIDIPTNGYLYVFGDVSIGSGSTITSPIGDYDEFLSGEPELTDWLNDNYNTDLPIELSEFTAFVTPKGISFSWITASETNNDFFTLEYSTDGIEFNPIATISGMGTSSVQNEYTFFDDSPNYIGLTYFRLKQTDYDGAYSYSHILSVEIKNYNANILIYPNPATDKISIEDANHVITNIRFFDSHYKQIHANNISPETYDISTLPQGIYYKLLKPL